jgi:hypothetical protein
VYSNISFLCFQKHLQQFCSFGRANGTGKLNFEYSLGRGGACLNLPRKTEIKTSAVYAIPSSFSYSRLTINTDYSKNTSVLNQRAGATLNIEIIKFK